MWTKSYLNICVMFRIIVVVTAGVLQRLRAGSVVGRSRERRTGEGAFGLRRSPRFVRNAAKSDPRVLNMIFIVGFNSVAVSMRATTWQLPRHTLCRLLSELVPGRAYASDFPDLGYFDKAAA
jgi:hypothetical protein